MALRVKRRRSTMSRKTKNNLIRKGIIFASFGAEFAVAFLCMITNSIICYGVLAVCGLIIPAYFSSLTR